VNPDEVVALGAAVQAGVLTGEVKDMLLLDVTPLSLGVETLGGVMTVMIPRNTTIPARKSEIYSTAADSQTSVDIHVLQGERSMAKDNRTLGKFRLEGILPAPRGVPKIEVTFDIDANGIVNVSAKDTATGKEQKISITSSSGLTEREIDDMVKAAEQHRSEDEERRKAVATRNEAEQLVFSTERMLNENRDKLHNITAKEVESAIAALKDAIESNDTALIESAKAALTKAAHKAAEAAYQTSPGSAESSASPRASSDTSSDGGRTWASTGTDDDVIDAEFEEKR